LESTAGLSFTAGSNGSASMTVTGTVSNLDAALAGLTFTAKTGYSGSASLAISVTDSSDKLSGSASVPITVVAFIPPTVSVPSSVSVYEDASVAFTGPYAISITDGQAGSNNDTLKITATHGTAALGSTGGLTFTAGSNGSATMTVSGTITNLSAALATLTYTPKTGYSGSASLVVTLSDAADKLSASGTVPITVAVPASTPTVTVGTPVTTSVPGEPVPLVFQSSDTYVPAESGSFSFSISFGDGTSATVSSLSPLVDNHVYKTTGTYTVTVTATDEFGNASTAATLVINVVPVAVETNPFNTSQTALFVGTSGKETISFTASAGGITVSINGVSEGTFNTTGPIIIFGQGGKDTVQEGTGVTNTVYVLATATADNIEADLDNEALQWAGLSAAVKILNS
jgi:large repetitive protein